MIMNYFPTKPMLCTWWSNIYVQKQFAFKALLSIKVQSSGWEDLCVQLSHQKPRSQQYILCSIYRTPKEIVDDLNTFTNELSFLLVKVKNLKHSSYLCDD